MDLQIALLLGQDGITNGAIYALLSLALVLVFAVTRVIFIPQGKVVAFGALTLASFQAGQGSGNALVADRRRNRRLPLWRFPPSLAVRISDSASIVFSAGIFCIRLRWRF